MQCPDCGGFNIEDASIWCNDCKVWIDISETAKESHIRWIKLSEERPPEEGFYLTYNPRHSSDWYADVVTDLWVEKDGDEEAHFSSDPWRSVSHWTYLEMPAED